MRWALLLMLAVAPAAVPSLARAQAARSAPIVVGVILGPTGEAPSPALLAQRAAATTTAHARVSTAERRAWQLGGQRTGLNQRYSAELVAVDKLKRQKRSWRRDRELQDALAEANETATQLAQVAAQLATAQTELGRARAALVVAIDAELAAGARSGPRGGQLAKLRAAIAPAPAAARRIVMPDMKIDAFADPEELDQQAVAFREAEAALSRQVAGLEQHAQELGRVSELRRQHDRTIELERRDDNTTRRNAPGGTNRGESPTFASGPEDDAAGGSVEASAAAALVDVVDVSVTDGLTRAQRSNDPAQREVAVRHARDAAAAQLERLRKKRLEIEKAARDRRR